MKIFNRKRVVIVSHAGIGDTVHVIPAIREIRKRFGSSATLTYWGHIADSREINSHVTLSDQILMPLRIIDEIVTSRWSDPFLLIKARTYFVLGIFRWLIDPTVMQVIFLLPDQRYSRRAQFLNVLSKIFRRKMLLPLHDPRGDELLEDIPFCLKLVDGLRRQWPDSVYDDIGNKPLFALPEDSLKEASDWLERKRKYPDRPILIICPGASNPANRWPIDRFIDLITRLQREGQFWVVLCGGSNDRQICQRISQCCPDVTNACGELSILGTAALFLKADLFVGLDTGTTHLASVCGVPYVALYGLRMTERLFFPPLDHGDVIQRWVPCGGCGSASCSRADHACMSRISVDDVLAAVKKPRESGFYLSATRPARWFSG